jgi:hypothetical protein
MGKTIALAAAFCLLLAANSFAAEGVDLDLAAHTPVNAAARSAVLPGWGQYFNGQATKGYIVASGFVLTAVTAYLFYDKANATYDDYEKLGVRNSSLYSDYETQSNQAMVASFFAAGIWVYGIVDAYVIGNRTQINPYARNDEGLRIASAGPAGIGLRYRARF